MREHTRLCLLVMLCMSTLTLSAWGQNPTGTITGKVTDASGSVVPQASITVTNENTGLARETTTDDVGDYRVPLLPIGFYSVKVEQSGFKGQIKKGLKLEVQQTARIDFQMEIGEVQEVVSVDAQAPLLEVENSSSGQVIKNEQVTNLPLNVRQFLQLTFLTPFSIPATRDLRSTLEPRDTVVPTVGGQRPESNNYQIDGFDNREGGVNSFSVNPPVDSIGEFKVHAGIAPAEFGRTSGTVINVVSKSGTNEIHGNLYEYLRNDLFDARPFFGSSKSPLKRNQFGGSLGGPIIKNKLLLFGNYEGFRQRSGGAPVIGRVPTDGERNGIFLTRIVDPLNCTNPRDKATCQEFPQVGNTWVIPRQRFSSTSAMLLDLWPQANLTGDPARNYQFQPPSAPIDRDNLSIRGDYNMGVRDTVYVRYILNDESVTTPPTYPSGIGGRTFTLNAWTLGGHYNHVFSPRVVNDVGVAYMDYRNENAAFLANGENIHKRVGITNTIVDVDPLFTGSPGISVPGFLGLGEATPNNRDGYNYEITDNLSWQRGRHSLRLGGDVRKTLMENFYTGSPSSHGFSNVYSLNNFADFLLGLPASINKTARAHPYGGNTHYFAGYFQDDWKVSPRLTLNLGVRYEIETAIHVPTYDFVGWDQQKGEMVVQDKIPTHQEIEAFYRDVRPDIKVRFDPNDTAYDADKNNFSPRFGFAYQLNRRMVLRGGFGIFYTGPQVSWIVANDFAPNFLRPIWTGDSVRPVVVLPDSSEIPTGYNPEGSGGPEATVRYPAPLTIFPITSRDFPYSENNQWLLSWQTEITSSLMIEAQYLGSRTTHLLGFTNTNTALDPSPAAVQPRLPFPSFARIQALTMGMDGWFQGLALKGEKRLSGGLSFLASYSWSKSLDTGSVLEAGPLWTDPRNQWATAKGPSNYDAPHRFVVSYHYELPFGRGKHFGNSLSGAANMILGGWGVRGVTFFQSGFAYNPTVALARANICAAACSARPDRIADGNLPKDIRTENGLSRDPSVAFWDFNAFVVPALTAPRLGNSGRSVLRGPGRNNWDLGIFKDFKFSENISMEFRYEMFNAWNHPDFVAPSSNLENRATFGKITATEPPRISQFVLKLNF